MSRVSNRQSALLTATISRRGLTLFARNNGTNCRFDLNSNREFKVARTSFPRARARQASTREEPPARKAKQIWRRSALFAKGYLAHFEKKFVFTRDCITKKVLSYFEIWKKSASGAQCSCFRYKWALVLCRSCLDRGPRKYKHVQEVSK